MKKDYQEHELTAFLLDELDDDRRSEIVDILKKSGAARQELEEIRQAIGEVGEALAEEPAMALNAEQRGRLHAEFEKTPKPGIAFMGVTLRLPRSMAVRWSAGLAAAACFVVVLFLSWEAAKQPVSVSPVKQEVQQEMARQYEAREEPSAKEPASAGDQAVLSEPIIGTQKEAAKDRRQELGSVPGRSESRARQSEQSPKIPATPASPQRANSIPVPAFKGKVTDTTGAPLPGASVQVASGNSKSAPVQNSANPLALPGHPVPAPAQGPAKDEKLYRFTVPLAGTESGGGVSRTKALMAPSFSAPMPEEEQSFNTESYDYQADNEITAVAKDPLSTFSIDVDTASYSNVRRFLREGRLPPPDAVRIEEMINYFPYDYEPPHDRSPFAVATEVAQAPWAPEHRLVRVALKGRELPPSERPAANLVFLLDVSGSMQSAVKLPLVKQAIRLLVEKLENSDRVSIVVYAGASGLVLQSTAGSDKQRILNAIDQLEAGGSTHASAGIELAYREALANFKANGINRVILATDGDFNVGITNQGELVRMVQQQAAKGVYLTALGFGMGNYKDSMLEKLADKGNGNYAYIDSLDEARKVLVEQMGGTLVTIAKDVKIQVEFNPLEVTAYRLIGYENRVMAHQDFDDDRKDAGEIGAGHTVTALYEVVPVGVAVDLPQGEPLKYQRKSPAATARGELLTVKLRYKLPNEETSRKFDVPVVDSMRVFNQASDDFRFAAAVAGFGMILRNSPFKGSATFESMMQIADTSRHFDPQGYRAEFVRLVGEASRLAGNR